MKRLALLLALATLVSTAYWIGHEGGYVEGARRALQEAYSAGYLTHP